MNLLRATTSLADVRELLTTSEPGVQLDLEQRRSLAARLRDIPTLERRRLDAWTIEMGGRTDSGFVWTPPTARRVLGNAAARRVRREGITIGDAVRDEISEHLVRAARGHVRGGSLAWWLADVPHPVLGIVLAEAVTWATQLLDFSPALGEQWDIADVDAFYDVAGARTSLRGRRDIVVGANDNLCLVRVRAGAPGRSAGAGLRVDLLIHALAHQEGQAPQRMIGLWPDANMALAVNGDLATLRAGARDILRAALVSPVSRAA